MLSRRSFLNAAGTGLVAAPLAVGQPARGRRKKMAIVTTVWRYGSHALHMREPFLTGYPLHGKWHRAARAMKFPFLAGSSLPVTWRMPAIDMPYGAEVEEVLCVAIGSVDSYDFHALETIQCMAERRRGGETGVTAVQALRGEAVWKAMAAGSWQAGGWAPRLFEAWLWRRQKLAAATAGSPR